MEFENGVLQFSPFMSVTLGIVVLFLGKRINDAVGGMPRCVKNLEAMGADEDDVTVCQCARGLKGPGKK